MSIICVLDHKKPLIWIDSRETEDINVLPLASDMQIYKDLPVLVIVRKYCSVWGTQGGAHTFAKPPQ